MNRTFTILILLLILILIRLVGHAQSPPEPSGRRLRAIVEDLYPDRSIIIGGTTGAWAFGSSTGAILDREFNYVTPENDFKQWNIHPDNSSNWNWKESDAWINHIASNGQILRIHGPIGPQCSHWAQDDSRTAAELDSNMNNFMEAICKRYNGTSGFEYMDVVNETVISGSWHRDKPGLDWENPWFKIGQDTDPNKTPLYIKNAFIIADQYAPDIKLIFNHHENPESTASWLLIKETIAYLRNQGIRVDGIGWQAHVNVGWETTYNLQKLKELIDWAHNNQLEFHVTEASVWLKQGVTEAILDKQADTYRVILEVLLEKSTSGKVGWNTWHIDDGHGWHTEWYPSIFGNNYAAKPSYYAIQETLEGSPTSYSYPKNYPGPPQIFTCQDPDKSNTRIILNKPVVEASILIYDCFGNLFRILPVKNSQEITIRDDEFSAGLYLITVLEEEELIGRGKMLMF